MRYCDCIRRLMFKNTSAQYDFIQNLLVIYCKMDPSVIKAYYRQPELVNHEVWKAENIGLGEAEAKILTRVFNPNNSLLELGCRAGRIALGLWELDYTKVLGVDFSREMIKAARRLNKEREAGVCFHVSNTDPLDFEDNLFDGAIWGGNGLMEIPRRANRRQALSETYRVIRPGSWCVFATPDRDDPAAQAFWHQEARRWSRGLQDKRLEDYGDLLHETPYGAQYLHVPSQEEVREDLKTVGFRIEVDVPRSLIAKASPKKPASAYDYRFWVIQRPDALAAQQMRLA